MTIMNLFFQLPLLQQSSAGGSGEAMSSSATEHDILLEEGVRSGEFNQPGCMGRCIYLVEHPLLLLSKLSPLASDITSPEQRWGPIFSCTVDLGVIGKGRLFESQKQLTSATLRKFGVDSFLLFGRYDDASSIGTLVDPEDDDAAAGPALNNAGGFAPSAAKLSRFFVVLSGERVSNVVEWNERVSLPQRLATLPKEPMFSFVDAHNSTDDAILVEQVRDASQFVFSRAELPRLTIQERQWVSKSIATVQAKKRYAADVEKYVTLMLRNGETPCALPLPPIVPSFAVLVINVALGNVDSTVEENGSLLSVSSETCARVDKDDASGAVAIDTTVSAVDDTDVSLDVTLSSCMSQLCSSLAPSDAAAVRNNWIPNFKAVHNGSVRGFSNVRMNHPEEQCIPLANDQTFAVCFQPLYFLTLCSGKRQEPLFLSVNHAFMMAKKKTVLRVVELAGLTMCASFQRKRVLGESKITVGDDQVSHNNEAVSHHEAQSKATCHTSGESAPSATAAPGGPSSTPLKANKKRSPVLPKGSARRLNVFWDLDRIHSASMIVQFRSLLRMLSINDMYDSSCDSVAVHLFTSAAVSRNNSGNPSSMAFSSVAEMLIVAQSLFEEVTCVLHANRNPVFQSSILCLESAARFVECCTQDEAPRTLVALVADAAAIQSLDVGNMALQGEGAWALIDGVVMCDSDGASISELAAKLRSHSLKRLFLVVDTPTGSTFRAVAAPTAAAIRMSLTSAASENRTTHSHDLFFEDTWPPELTLADLYFAEPAGQKLLAKSYGSYLLPFLRTLHSIQRSTKHRDVLLRDIFSSMRSEAHKSGGGGAVPTEILYSAFHTLVGKGWLSPGYGKEFLGQMYSKTVCWVCFTSNIHSSLTLATAEQQPLAHKKGDGEGDDEALLALLPKDIKELHVKPSVPTSSAPRRLRLSTWIRADHLLDAMPRDVVELRSLRQWMPLELHNARKNNAIDQLRVLIPLMTLQRQHNKIAVDMEALIERCVTLERMILVMEGDSSSPSMTVGGAARRYVPSLGGGAYPSWHFLREDSFRHDVENALQRDRLIVRMSDNTVCFVSDVLAPPKAVVSCLETVQIDPAFCSSHQSPQELQLVYVMTSTTRFLLIRALREEQRVEFPGLSVRLRDVRKRWHQLCVHSGLVPTVPLWERTRAELERSKIIYVFASSTSSTTSLMLLWSDVLKVSLTARDAGTLLLGLRGGTVDAEEWQHPPASFFACNLGDTRLCGGADRMELNRLSFRRDVQLFPQELTFATQQDSLPEHYLLLLHAVQKLQRSVVVDATVCDYIVARLLQAQSSSSSSSSSSWVQDAANLTVPQTPTVMAVSMQHQNYLQPNRDVQLATPATNTTANLEGEEDTNAISSVWARILETQALLATHRLIYVSGADVSFGSDFLYHTPYYNTLPKSPRLHPFVDEPVEFHHETAVLDAGVRILLESLLHMQRLWKRLRVSWDSMSKVLFSSKQLPSGDTPDDVLNRAIRAGGLVHVLLPSASSTSRPPPPTGSTHVEWSTTFARGTVITFVSDAAACASGATTSLPLPPTVLPTSVASVPPPVLATTALPSSGHGSAFPPTYEQHAIGAPPSYSSSIAPAVISVPMASTVSSSTSKLNPFSKPFQLPSQSFTGADAYVSSPPATASEIPTTTYPASESEKSGEAQLPSSLEMLKQLTSPSTMLNSPPKPQQQLSVADAIVPLSSLSKRSRVVQRKGDGIASQSMLSQLFLTLENLETKSGADGEEDKATTSCASSARAPSPFVREGTPLVAAPPTPIPAAPPDATSTTTASAHKFISALAWLFESAIEDVSALSKAEPPVTQSSEQVRRRKLCYSTLAAFFDTAAAKGSAVSQVSDEMFEGGADDFDDGVVPDQQWVAAAPQSVDDDNERRGNNDEIVVPSRNRPQLSNEQKRAIRQLHAKLTQAAMIEDHPKSEPWESVGFFFAKAEAIAGLHV